jgi:hypothetical protein
LAGARVLAVAALALLPALSACGGGGNDGEGAVIDGIAVQGSTRSGLFLAATNPDPSIKTSRLYHYDFASGQLTEVLGAESGNPALFAADGHVFLFNRQPGTIDVRVLDPAAPKATPAAAMALSGVEAGDPWDVATLVSGRALLLASPLGGKLQTLDYTSGAVETVDDAGIASDALRPIGLLRNASKIYALHSAVSASDQADGSQQMYVLSPKDDGTAAFVDVTAATAAIDGYPVTASNPSSFVNRSGGNAVVVGLCSESMSDCTAGSDRLADGKLTKARTFESGAFPYAFVNQIVDGPSDTAVYAHVRSTSDDGYRVIKLDAESGSVQQIHTFADERLYGIAYDKSSKTLFVGGRNGLKGTMTLYRDRDVIGTFELDGVPYSSAFIDR